MKATEIYDPLIKHLIEKLIKRFQSQVHIADVKLVLMLPTQSNERIIQIFHNAALKVNVLYYDSHDHSVSPFFARGLNLSKFPFLCPSNSCSNEKRKKYEKSLII